MAQSPAERGSDSAYPHPIEGGLQDSVSGLTVRERMALMLLAPLMPVAFDLRIGRPDIPPQAIEFAAMMTDALLTHLALTDPTNRRSVETDKGEMFDLSETYDENGIKRAYDGTIEEDRR